MEILIKILMSLSIIMIFCVVLVKIFDPHNTNIKLKAVLAATFIISLFSSFIVSFLLIWNY